MTTPISSLPEWILAIKMIWENNRTNDVEQLVDALAIAWEALEDIHYAMGLKVAKKAMCRIRELGKTK